MAGVDFCSRASVNVLTQRYKKNNLIKCNCPWAVAPSSDLKEGVAVQCLALVVLFQAVIGRLPTALLFTRTNFSSCFQVHLHFET